MVLLSSIVNALKIKSSQKRKHMAAEYDYTTRTCLLPKLLGQRLKGLFQAPLL